MSLAAILVVPLVALFVVGAIISLLKGGGTLVRFVEVACVGTIVVATLRGAITIGESLVSDITMFQVSLAVHVPEVRVPGLTVDRASAVILSGGADRATLTVTGLSWASRLLLAAESVLQVVVTIVIALMTLRLARNLRAGKPFDGLARSLVQCAIVLFLGALLWSFVGGIGSYTAGREALEIHGMSAMDGTIGAQIFPETPADLSYFGWPEPTLFIVFPFWPLGIASALALLGAAFRAGERLQADTEGLV